MIKGTVNSGDFALSLALARYLSIVSLFMYSKETERNKMKAFSHYSQGFSLPNPFVMPKGRVSIKVLLHGIHAKKESLK